MYGSKIYNQFEVLQPYTRDNCHSIRQLTLDINYRLDVPSKGPVLVVAQNLLAPAYQLTIFSLRSDTALPVNPVTVVVADMFVTQLRLSKYYRTVFQVPVSNAS